MVPNGSYAHALAIVGENTATRHTSRIIISSTTAQTGAVRNRNCIGVITGRVCGIPINGEFSAPRCNVNLFRVGSRLDEDALSGRRRGAKRVDGFLNLANR